VKLLRSYSSFYTTAGAEDLKMAKGKFKRSLSPNDLRKFDAAVALAHRLLGIKLRSTPVLGPAGE
jgi:hypothetical protein